ALKLISMRTRATRTLQRKPRVTTFAFSPDSKRLAYITNTSIFPTGGRLSIRTLATGAVRKVLPDVPVEVVDWVSTRLLDFDLPFFLGSHHIETDIATVRANGTGFRRLTNVGSLPIDQFGFVTRGSVDGRWLILDAVDDLDHDPSYAVKVTGGGLHP